jgi:hypothetical protein
MCKMSVFPIVNKAKRETNFSIASFSCAKKEKKKKLMWWGVSLTTYLSSAVQLRLE